MARGGGRDRGSGFVRRREIVRPARRQGPKRTQRADLNARTTRTWAGHVDRAAHNGASPSSFRRRTPSVRGRSAGLDDGLPARRRNAVESRGAATGGGSSAPAGGDDAQPACRAGAGCSRGCARRIGCGRRRDGGSRRGSRRRRRGCRRRRRGGRRRRRCRGSGLSRSRHRGWRRRNGSGRRLGGRRRGSGRCRRLASGKQRQRIDVAMLVGRDADAEVHVWPVVLDLAARANGSDVVALADTGSLLDTELADVRQRDRKPVGGRDRDRQPIRRHRSRERDDAFPRGANRLSGVGADVDAPVLPGRVGIRAGRERAKDGTTNRPGPGLPSRSRDEPEEDSRDPDHDTPAGQDSGRLLSCLVRQHRSRLVGG
jgi:hypothetical protein